MGDSINSFVTQSADSLPQTHDSVPRRMHDRILVYRRFFTFMQTSSKISKDFLVLLRHVHVFSPLLDLLLGWHPTV